MDINGVNNTPQLNMVSGANTVESQKLLNCSLNTKSVIPNTAFTGEEQHALGILANYQDCIAIED